MNLLTIQSFNPWSWLKKPLSWRASLSVLVPGDRCSFCHVAHFDGNVGFSQSLFSDQWRAYELAGLYTEIGRGLSYGWRIGPRLTFGLVGNLSSRWKQQIEAVVMFDPRRGTAKKTIPSLSAGQSYFFSQEWEARLLGRTFFHTSTNASSRGEIQLQTLFYF